MWEATYLPFGGVHTSSAGNIDLRFPGQWFQSESGLHQNWMRDYDPTTGRYIQADPLGLVDGASVYGYVRQNPGRYTDFRGGLAEEGYLAALAALAAADAMSPEPSDFFPVPKILGYCVVAVVAVVADGLTNEACGCEEDCPSPAEARKIANSVGSALVKKYKLSGVGTGARSGQHGTPFLRAGAEMGRRAKEQTCVTLKNAYLWKSKQLILRGRSINH